MYFENNILNLMIEVKISSDELASKLEITRTELDEYVLMKMPLPNEILFKLTKIFNCDANKVLYASI